MWNPRPGPKKPDLVCQDYPDLAVYGAVVGNDADHAHVNEGGATFACEGQTERRDD